MHARIEKIGLAAFILACVVAFLNRSGLGLQYHKIACKIEERASVEAGKGRFGLIDHVRQRFGVPPADHLAAFVHHQQALVDAGVLSRRDIKLKYDYDLAMFSRSNILSIGGDLSTVWFQSSSQLVVIAKPERIDQLTRWINEHDTSGH